MKKTKISLGVLRIRPGQALLLSLFLLLVISIIIAGLSQMLIRDVQIRSIREYNTIAFYLAQSGIEKAKVEILYDYWPAGTYAKPGAPNNWYYAPGGRVCTSTDNYCDLSFPNGLKFRYQYSIINPGAGSTERTLTSIGQVLSADGAVLSQKTISTTITGIANTNAGFCHCILYVSYPENNLFMCAVWNNSACASCVCSSLGGPYPHDTCLSFSGCPSAPNGVDDDLSGKVKPNSWKEQ